MSWPNIGATHYHTELGLQTKFVQSQGGCLQQIWYLEPLDLINGLALGCYKPSTALRYYIRRANMQTYLVIQQLRWFYLIEQGRQTLCKQTKNIQRMPKNFQLILLSPQIHSFNMYQRSPFLSLLSFTFSLSLSLSLPSPLYTNLKKSFVIFTRNKCQQHVLIMRNTGFF